jgi:hypothetical protein
VSLATIRKTPQGGTTVPDNDFSVCSMADSIASDLLGTPSSPYGALIIGEVFPSGGTPPAYFDQSYTLLTSFVNQTITPGDRTAISAALDGVQTWVTDTYRPLRANPSSTPAMLHASVQPVAGQLIAGVIQPLMSADAAPAGLAVFLLAAGVHLALVQELAYTDPMHQSEGGIDSPFASSVKEYAQQYHDFVVATWSGIVTTRVDAITPVQYVSQPPSPVVPMDMSYSTWSDPIDGVSDHVMVLPGVTGVPGYAPSDDATITQASADRDAHVSAVLAGLLATLGQPPTLAAQFLELVASPLPSSGRILSLTGSGGGTVNYDNGFQQKAWSYSLSWSTSGGTAAFDGVGEVAASGSLSFNQANTPPAIPAMLTVTGRYGPPVTQAIHWG